MKKWPEALIVKKMENKSSPGCFVVTVACPYKCGRAHIHGWEPGDMTERVAHCAEGSHRLYVITPDE